MKDRGAAGVDLGAPGWKKTSYRRPVDNGSPRSSRSPTVSPCCNTVQVRFITVYPGGNTVELRFNTVQPGLGRSCTVHPGGYTVELRFHTVLYGSSRLPPVNHIFLRSSRGEHVAAEHPHQEAETDGDAAAAGSR